MTFDPPLLFDTSWNPDASPDNERAFAIDIFYWSGDRYLIYHTGNELETKLLNNPQNPGSKITSRFNVPPFGDRDYNLFNFSVCDDCRYGLAGYETQGTVLFDLGNGGSPRFSNKLYYPDAGNVGGLTFKHGNQQYLIVNFLPGGCSSASLFTFNGVTDNDRQFLQCLEPGAENIRAYGGFYISSSQSGDGQAYVYLVDGTKDVHMYRVLGSGTGLSLEWRGTVIKGGIVSGSGIRLDLDAPQPFPRLAVAATNWGTTMWDLTDVDLPMELVTWDPNPVANANIAAIEFPYIWVGMSGIQSASFFYDITDPTDPQLIDPDFWNSSQVWNAYEYSSNKDVIFTEDAHWLFMARFSVVQRFEIDCVDVAPVASFSIDPSPAFPGEAVNVTNMTGGLFTEAAIWITDSQDTIVEGTGTLDVNEPDSRTYTIPVDLASGESYTAHVAVASVDYPCDDPVNYPELCGDQYTSGPISINREPHPAIVVTPETVITLDDVTLDGSNTEGQPTDYLWEVMVDGGTPPGHPPFGFDPTAETTQYHLSASGTWEFKLTASYAHQNGIGLWQDTVSEVREVSSVAAEFDFFPSDPVNTEDITLCSTSKYAGDLTALGIAYDWRVYYDLNHTDLRWSSNQCNPSTVGCMDCGVVIPADTFPDDTHTYYVELGLENVQSGHAGEGDVSTVEEQMVVADGSVDLDFNYFPIEPEVGTILVFRVTGIPGEIEEARWNFGGPGCTGYAANTTCEPGIFEDCKDQAYRYSSAGTKTVSLYVDIDGKTYGPVSHQVTVAASGSCGGGSSCTYTLSPTFANYGASGGTGQFSVDASGTSCQWQATEDVDWIQITSGSSGTGDGTVRYTVTSYSGSQRTAYIRVEGKTYTVSQTGSGTATVDFTISDTSPDIGEEVTFTVSSEWTPVKWIMGENHCDGRVQEFDCSFAPALCRTVRWEYPNSGTKSVTFIAEEGSKTRTLTVNNQGLCEGTCDKDGPPVASFAMGPNPVLLGETVTFTDTSSQQPKVLAADFSWAPQSPKMGEMVNFSILGVASVDQAEWDFGAGGCQGYAQEITCKPLFGDCMVEAYKYAEAGTFTVTLKVDGGTTRSHQITVLNEGSCDGGGGCTFTISPTSKNFPAAGGNGSVAVATGDGCAWSAQSNNSWIHLTSSPAGIGPDTVTYTVDSNSSSSRSGSMRIAGKNFVVTQDEAGGGGGGGDTLPTSWQWTIKLDGSTVHTSSSPSFTYAFAEVGEYLVTLQAANCAGSDLVSQTLIVFDEIIPEDFVVPAVVHAPGHNNTLWKSDLRMFNSEEETVNCTLEYQPQASADVTYYLFFDMQPRGTQVIDDVVTYYNLPGDNNQGSLRINCEGSDGFTTPLIMSRTYNDTPQGTYGQYVPAIPVLPPGAEALHFTGLVHNSEYRTNMGLTNMGIDPLGNISVSILDEFGAELGNFEVGIPPGATVPLVSVSELAGVSYDLHLFTTRVDIGDAEVTGYASVIDNATGDPMLLTAPLVTDLALYVPGIAHLPGANDSQWRSDVSVFNPHNESIEAFLKYVPDEQLPFTYAISVELDPGEAYMVRDFLTELIGPDVNSKGYVMVSSVGDAPAPQVAARTYNQALTGTFGQNLKVFGAEDVIPEEAHRYIPGVVGGPDIGFRTNLGLLNTSTSSSAQVEIMLYDAQGEIVGEALYPLQARQFVQFDLFNAFGLGSTNLQGSLRLRIVDGGPVAAYCSVVDNGTQDPILVPALLAY